MGQYKVPQDVETEDKILGPLSIKQFIYVIIGLLWAFLMWRVFSFSIIVAIAFALPVTGFFLLLGFGRREGVPFEDYVVAFIRFLIVPRKRIWIKDDTKEQMVRESPKSLQTTGSAKKEVSVGQLKQLATIIDTRGNFKDPSVQIANDDTDAAVYANRIIGPSQNMDSSQISVQGQLATQNDDVLDEAGQRSLAVNQLLENVEQSTKANAISQVQTALQEGVADSSASDMASHLGERVINPLADQMAKKAGSLTVTQLAGRLNYQQAKALEPGSTVQLRQPSL